MIQGGQHTPQVKATAKAIVNDLNADIQRLRADKVWCRDDRAMRNIRNKIKGRKNSILLMNAIAERLPPSLEFFTVAVQSRPWAEQDRQRFDFDTGERRHFLKQVFADAANHKNLLAMGLDEEKIDLFVRENRFPALKPQFPYDITVDHAIDISFGGSNEASNLFVIPGYVNNMKARLTSIQQHLGRKELLSFRPAATPDGKRSAVPLIPGGFQLVTQDRDTLKRRMETLLNANLK